MSFLYNPGGNPSSCPKNPSPDNSIEESSKAVDTLNALVLFQLLPPRGRRGLRSGNGIRALHESGFCSGSGSGINKDDDLSISLPSKNSDNLGTLNTGTNSRKRPSSDAALTSPPSKLKENNKLSKVDNPDAANKYGPNCQG